MRITSFLEAESTEQVLCKQLQLSPKNVLERYHVRLDEPSNMLQDTNTWSRVWLQDPALREDFLLTYEVAEEEAFKSLAEVEINYQNTKRKVNIISLYKYIVSQLFGEQRNSLIEETNELKAIYNSLTKQLKAPAHLFKFKSRQALIEARNAIFGQFGKKLLPEELLTVVIKKEIFLDHVLPQVGKYVLLALHVYKTSLECIQYQQDAPDLSLEEDVEAYEPESVTELSNKQLIDEIANRLRSLDKSSVKRRSQAEYYIRCLRPSVKAIKDQYRAQGESEEIINKLVTVDNYQHLPAVRITRQQQQALLHLLHGREDKYQELINQG